MTTKNHKPQITSDTWVDLCADIMLGPDHFKSDADMFDRAHYYGKHYDLDFIGKARAAWENRPRNTGSGPVTVLHNFRL